MISLRSKVAVKILNYFFINPEARHYINELAGILGLDPKNTDTKLKELERAGLLKSEFSGKQRYFYLSKEFPLLEEYKKIVTMRRMLSVLAPDERTEILIDRLTKTASNKEFLDSLSKDIK